MDQRQSWSRDRALRLAKGKLEVKRLGGCEGDPEFGEGTDVCAHQRWKLFKEGMG